MLAVSARALVFVFWPWGFCCYCRCRSSPPGAASVRGSSRIPPAAPMRSGDRGRCCRPSRWPPVSMTSSPACSACRGHAHPPPIAPCLCPSCWISSPVLHPSSCGRSSRAAAHAHRWRLCGAADRGRTWAGSGPAATPLHRDPFDRLLLAQAEREGLLLITADTLLGPLSGSGTPSGQLLSRVQAYVVACRSVRLQERFLRGGQQRTTAVNATRPHLS